MDKKSSDLVRKSEKGGFSAGMWLKSVSRRVSDVCIARSMWESKVVRGQSSEATEHDKGMLWTCVRIIVTGKSADDIFVGNMRARSRIFVRILWRRSASLNFRLRVSEFLAIIRFVFMICGGSA